MTEHDDDAFPDAGRLRDAMAEEVDRPGLEGPSFDAVMRSAGRIRRRRVTAGATFAVAAVALATSVTASRVGGSGAGGGNRGAAAEGTPGTATVSATTAGGSTAGGSTAGGTATTATSGTTSGTGAHIPADVVLKTGTSDGHPWRFVIHFDPNVRPSSNDCGSLSLYVDDIWTNAGGSSANCFFDGQLVYRPRPLSESGFSAIEIIDTHHAHYGSIVSGDVNPAVTSVVAQCVGGKKYDATPFAAGGGYYYVMVFPSGSNCPHGTLSFFDASHQRVGFMEDVGLGLAK